MGNDIEHHAVHKILTKFALDLPAQMWTIVKNNGPNLKETFFFCITIL